MAVLDFIKDINTAIDSNMYTASIFMEGVRHKKSQYSVAKMIPLWLLWYIV